MFGVARQACLVALALLASVAGTARVTHAQQVQLAIGQAPYYVGDAIEVGPRHAANQRNRRVFDQQDAGAEAPGEHRLVDVDDRQLSGREQRVGQFDGLEGHCVLVLRNARIYDDALIERAPGVVEHDSRGVVFHQQRTAHHEVAARERGRSHPEHLVGCPRQRAIHQQP